MGEPTFQVENKKRGWRNASRNLQSDQIHCQCKGDQIFQDSMSQQPTLHMSAKKTCGRGHLHAHVPEQAHLHTAANHYFKTLQHRYHTHTHTCHFHERLSYPFHFVLTSTPMSFLPHWLILGCCWLPAFPALLPLAKQLD